MTVSDEVVVFLIPVRDRSQFWPGKLGDGAKMQTVDGNAETVDDSQEEKCHGHENDETHSHDRGYGTEERHGARWDESPQQPLVLRYSMI